MTITEITATTVAVGGVVALTITPTDITTGIIATAALVTAIGTSIASIITARGNTRKIEEVVKTTKTIEGHVNSAATKAAQEIEALRRELSQAMKVAAENREIAALLAQSVAIKTVTVQAAPPPAAAPPVATVITNEIKEAKEAREEAAVKDAAAGLSLKKIEKHTKETADNTAATDATVNEIKKDQV